MEFKISTDSKTHSIALAKGQSVTVTASEPVEIIVQPIAKPKKKARAARTAPVRRRSTRRRTTRRRSRAG